LGGYFTLTAKVTPVIAASWAGMVLVSTISYNHLINEMMTSLDMEVAQNGKPWALFPCQT
jgi:hypothetical protein